MWVWDAVNGVYKDHTLSREIRRQAIADTQFMKFMRPEPGFGKGKGQSVTITRIMQLPLAGRVAEDDRLPSARPAINTKSIVVSEWGFKIPMTEFEKNLTYFDLSNQFQQLLRDQIQLTMDVMCAQALKNTPIKYTPVSTGGVIATNGTAGGTADVNLSIADLRAIHDELRNLKAPYFRGGKYVGILSTSAARGIKNDPEYKDWLAPTTSEPFVGGALKSIEGFDLYETNNAFSLANAGAVGSSSVLGEAIFLAADAGFLAVVENPELRAGIPEELGRFREVGWVGTLEAGVVWDIASSARIVHVTSA